MADFNPIFEVHAGKILAKLHLAGQLQANNSIIINTAIKNPVDKADPLNPGKVEFDLENKSGEYQLAIIRPLIYQVPIVLEKNKKLQKLFEDLKKAEEKAGKGKDKDDKKDDKKDAHADESLTAKTKDKDDKTNESIKSRKNLMKLLFEDAGDGDDIEDKEDDKDKDKDKDKKEVDPAVEKIQKQILAEFASYTKDKNSFKHGEYEEDDEDFEASVKSFKQAVEEENKGRLKDKEDAKNELKKNATEDMFTYFTNFAGKDNAKKINPEEIVVKNADADGKEASSPSKFDKIKDYAIVVDDVDDAIKDAEEKIQESDKPNDWMKHNVALIVGYKIDID